MRNSTEDTDGNWKGLALYDELFAACPLLEDNANEKKGKERRPLKPASDNQKKQKVLARFFFCPPVASLTAVDVVEMAVAEDIKLEEGGSAAAGIAVERSHSAAYMMLWDGDVAQVEFSDKR